MLAYVFWHRPAATEDRAEYEQVLGGFHRALAAAPPRGFVESAVHAVDGLAWLPGEVYEDWYVVERWDDLGALNDAAVDVRRAVAHEAAARAVADGVAGVYRLRAGGSSIAREGPALWLHKPRATPYERFRAELAALAAGDGGVWERQMLLGPAPEYCVLTGTAAAPAQAAAAVVTRRLVYG